MIASNFSPFSSDLHIRNTMQPTHFGNFSSWSEKKSSHLQTDGGFEKRLLTLSPTPPLQARTSPKVLEELPLSMDCGEADAPPEKDCNKQRRLSRITEVLRNTATSSPLKPKEPEDDLRKEHLARMEMIQLL
jgi:hypothetical protein